MLQSYYDLPYFNILVAVKTDANTAKTSIYYHYLHIELTWLNVNDWKNGGRPDNSRLLLWIYPKWKVGCQQPEKDALLSPLQ